MEAVKNFYESHEGDPETNTKMKICLMIGQYGIPTAFAIFAGFYWTMGLTKYYSG